MQINRRQVLPRYFIPIWESNAGICAIISVLTIFLYFAGLRIWAYGDDFGCLIRANAQPSWGNIFQGSSHEFRPLEKLINSINIAWLGYETTLLSHIASLFGMVVSVNLVYLLGRIVGQNARGMAVIAALFFAVSPLNVLSVIQIDTISQQYATVFILSYVVWLISQRNEHYPFVFHVVSGLWVLLALLSKETVFGAILSVPLVRHLLDRRRNGNQLREAMRYLVPDYMIIALAVSCYTALRVLSGAVFLGNPEENYSLRFSIIPMLVHMGQLLSALIYAGSSLDIYPHLKVGRALMSTILTLGVASVSGYGIFQMIRETRMPINPTTARSSLRVVYSLVILVIANMFPVVLIGHMSELYSYGSSPFYALLMGVLLEHATHNVKPESWCNRNKVKIVVALLIVTFMRQAVCTREKVNRALEISQRAQSYYRYTATWIEEVTQREKKGDISLCWRPTNGVESAYSGYVMPDRVVLRGVLSFVGATQGRNIKYIEAEVSPAICDYTATTSHDALDIVAQRR